MKDHTAAAVVAITTIAPCGGAATISYHELPEGLTHASLVRDSLRIDAASSSAPFMYKAIDGVTGVGVGGGVNGEIDFKEAIRFDFSRPVVITRLTLTNLFTRGAMSDRFDEVARVTTSDTDFLLSAREADAGTWTGLGTLANTSPASDVGSGRWTVHTDARSATGLFARPTTTLILRSGRPSRSAMLSDFSFVDIEFFAPGIPAPATAVTLACLAAATARRRRDHTR